jgi:hypothetical protein
MYRILLALSSAVLSYYIANTYTVRFTAYEGFYLIPTEEPPLTQQPDAPARTILALIDGLGEEAARSMPSIQRLQREGQCVKTHTGSLTVSRPVYASISSGVEQDRTGIRNNAEPIPATGTLAESIWEIAKEKGLHTTANTDLDWWQVLFPRGFTTYNMFKHEDNFFSKDLSDLTLIHPSYIDEAGHAHGASSAEYQAEVSRAEKELSSLLPRLDFSKDLLIVTSDHGHTWYGGHGGLQPEIVQVLTCYAGFGVKQSSAEPSFNARAIGPSIALFMGLRMPKHARVDASDEAVIMGLLDDNLYPKAYKDERSVLLKTRRTEQQRALGMSWDDLYQSESQWQLIRLGISLLVAVGVVLFLARKRGRELVFGLAWGAILFLLAAALYAWWRRSFDITSINSRDKFIAAVIPICSGVILVGCLAHRLIKKKITLLSDDLLLWVGLIWCTLLAHVIGFGWPLGFPWVTGMFLFYPFYGAAFGLLLSLALLVASIITVRNHSKD